MASQCLHTHTYVLRIQNENNNIYTQRSQRFAALTYVQGNVNMDQQGSWNPDGTLSVRGYNFILEFWI